MYSSTLSLTSALDGVGGQRHAPAGLLPGKTRYPLYWRVGGPRAGVDLLKNTVEKRPLYRLRRRCKDNIKMVVRLNSYYQSKRRYFPKDSNLC